MPITPASLLGRLRQSPTPEHWSRFVDLYAPVVQRWAARAGLQEADAADLLPLGYFGMQIIRIATDQGLVVIEVDDPKMEVTVKEKGAVIKDAQGGREVTLTAGEHELEVTIKDAAGETRFFTKKLTLSRGGKEVVNVRQELAERLKPPPAGADTSAADRRAAEWVLSIGGNIRIKENGQGQNIAAVGDLPRGAFELTGVDLNDNQKVSDAGLTHFKDCRTLTYLDLRDTQVSDAGLKELHGLTNLKELNLTNSKVTAAGVAALRKALPDCHVIGKPDN